MNESNQPTQEPTDLAELEFRYVMGRSMRMIRAARRGVYMHSGIKDDEPLLSSLDDQPLGRSNLADMTPGHRHLQPQFGGGGGVAPLWQAKPKSCSCCVKVNPKFTEFLMYDRRDTDDNPVKLDIHMYNSKGTALKGRRFFKDVKSALRWGDDRFGHALVVRIDVQYEGAEAKKCPCVLEWYEWTNTPYLLVPKAETWTNLNADAANAAPMFKEWNETMAREKCPDETMFLLVDTPRVVKRNAKFQRLLNIYVRVSCCPDCKDPCKPRELKLEQVLTFDKDGKFLPDKSHMKEVSKFKQNLHSDPKKVKTLALPAIKK